jgi:Zn-dependent protease
MGIEQVIIIAALILSIVLHEVAHGYAANWLGDPTARLQGRLSVNPLRHIDLLGSVIIPGLLFITNAGFLFGWAKPVPYNPYNLRNQRWGEAIVAAAGPATNILLAVIFAALIRLAPVLGLPFEFIDIAAYIVYINILLALFNMIPVPPLDGSKILGTILPGTLGISFRELMGRLEQYGLIFTFLFLFIFIQILWKPFSVIVFTIFEALTGLRGL